MVSGFCTGIPGNNGVADFVVSLKTGFCMGIPGNNGGGKEFGADSVCADIIKNFYVISP